MTLGLLGTLLLSTVTTVPVWSSIPQLRVGLLVWFLIPYYPYSGSSFACQPEWAWLRILLLLLLLMLLLLLLLLVM
jgi:hypothetical protein